MCARPQAIAAFLVALVLAVALPLVLDAPDPGSSPGLARVAEHAGLGRSAGAHTVSDSVCPQSANPDAKFVCTCVPKAPKNLTQVWVIRDIPYYIHSGSQLFDGTAKQQLIEDCFHTWTDHSCTDLRIEDRGYTTDLAGFDMDNLSANRNVVESVETASEAAALNMDPSLLAITLTSFALQTGEILDADILVNALHWRFTEVTNMSVCIMGEDLLGPYDLRNTLTHEMGHFLGFDHNPDPESTMYASADKCETKKRDLTDNDILGICSVYPKGKGANTCYPPADGYCSIKGLPDQLKAPECSSCSCVGVGPTPPGGSLALLATGGALLTIARRARRSAWPRPRSRSPGSGPSRLAGPPPPA